ncbi:MAG: efflux RND transporter permease subunit [Planctomycetaceae bacterium]|jgi:multidrug efflux pump subunit AcrB|nr:efflux RND transporter permease subunit [Planctomycetaceae bacterium]
MLKSVLRWTIANAPAVNIMLIVVLAAGVYFGFALRRETFPEFDLERIMVSVPYPGATPEEVENGICQKIEEALQSIEYVRKMTSTASEGSGSVMIELQSNVPDIDRTLNEIKEAVDRIPSFPELAEHRVVQRLKMQETVISIGVLGPEDNSIESALALRQVAEDLRSELLQYPKISMVNLVGTKDYQIDIEIPENTLRSYKMTLDQAANIVRQENIQTPGGTLRAPSQEINVRTDNRRYDGEGIGNLPFITTRDGTVIRLKDVANIRDEFVDGDISATVYTPPPEGIPKETDKISGRHVIALGVMRNTNEDLLAMVDSVYDFVRQKNESGTLPQGYSLITWGDHSVEVRSRLEMLLRNGLQGLIIVFILLTLFLDMNLAFWVALGIPVSICFTAVCLGLQGMTLNMVSMFGFIMGIGIVVDDAIVAGENVYRHREMGKKYFTAAVDGIAEIFPSVTSSVLTTIIAFTPLLFCSGMMGKIFYAVPVVMSAMLIASLAECFGSLSCHLAHKDNLFLKMLAGYLYIFSWLLIPVAWFRINACRAMEWTIKHIYSPTVRIVLHQRLIFMTASCCVLVLSFAVVLSGVVPYVFFPKIDGNQIQAALAFPNGTPAEVTAKWTQHLEHAFWKAAKEYEDAGTPVALRSFRVVGSQVQMRGVGGGGSGSGSSHQGGVSVELVGGTRTISSMEIANRWREAAGLIPGADELTFDTQMFGPPGGVIEFLLIAQSHNKEQLLQAVEECKAYLANIEGTKDIKDSDVPGKYEFRLKIKEKALAMGLHPGDLASVIRATYYGAEVQRLQRGRHEVKVMVCYPREDRRSLGDFNEIRIRLNTGGQESYLPITELADIEVVRGYTSITRRNQMQSITVSSDVDEHKANAQQIIGKLKSEFLPELMKKYPGVAPLWEGHEEERIETVNSLTFWFAIALCMMFALLTIQFRSYLQPFMIVAIIPFGWIGVVIAHWLAGQPISMTSGFGFVALAGVIINDSIVMIDFINRRIQEGADVDTTLAEVGADRFRPIFLTSVTTLGGLLPIVCATGLQAQMVIPMALSLAGGVAFALFFVLYFIPVLYSYYADLLRRNGIALRGILADNEVL